MADDREDLESFLPPRDDAPPPPPPPPPPPAEYYGAPDDGYPPRKPKTKRGEVWPWQQVWRMVLTQPRVETFEAILQDPTAGRNRAYTWVFAIGLVTGLLEAIGQLAWGSTIFSGGASGDIDTPSLLCCVPASALLAVLFFAISAGLQTLIARFFGGEGTYDATAYSLAAIYAPMTLATSTLSSLLPPLACLSVFLIAYWLALNVIAIKAVHEFTWGQALLTVFAPVLLIGLCVVAVIVTVLVGVSAS